MAKKKKVQAETETARGGERAKEPEPTHDCPAIVFRASSDEDVKFLILALDRTERDVHTRESREWRKELRSRLQDWHLWREAHPTDV
jgi:hypothetical protein